MRNSCIFSSFEKARIRCIMQPKTPHNPAVKRNVTHVCGFNTSAIIMKLAVMKHKKSLFLKVLDKM